MSDQPTGTRPERGARGEGGSPRPAVPSRAGGSSELARLRRTERLMVRCRWAGVAFGVVHALTFYRPYPAGMLALALAVMGMLAAGNVVVSLASRGAGESRLRRVAVGALALDVAAVMGCVFVYTFDVETAVWALIYILPLEAAIRFGLRGALATMAIVTVLWTGRETYGTWAYGNEFLPISMSFRMGIGFFIASVAGSMASNLVRDRRQAEDATARYESMMAAISHLGEGVGIVDADRVRYANEALGEILGYAPDELIALGSWADLVDERTPLDPAWQGELPASGRRFETAVVRKDGERREIEVGIKPVELDGGPQALAIVRDITERKRNELALASAYEREREAVRRLQQLDAVKTDFLATVSHELRTPVTKIVGFSATLLARWDAMDDDVREECVRRIASGGEQLTRLIAELLDFGRIEHGKLLLELGSCDLGDVLESTLCELGAALEQHTVEVTVPVATRVLANRDGLIRVLDNLLTNAVKFSPPGSTIRVRAVALGDDQVRVEVEDEGIGIPPGEVDRVFDRFHRLHRDATAPSGTGIGLAIVKEFVEAQGGRAWATSRPTGGAVMSFTLWRPGHAPVRTDAAAPPASPVPVRAWGSAGPGKPPTGRRGGRPDPRCVATGRSGMEHGPEQPAGRTMEGLTGGDDGDAARAGAERRGGAGGTSEPDPTDEAAAESFPASDPPAHGIPVE